MVLPFHILAGANFGGFAGVDYAINADFTSGDYGFALAATLRKAGEFKQIAQGDMFAGQLEGYGLHGGALYHCD